MAGEDQQREIVLGNKQLLSIFFIVVVMMGVAFTIGYIIGRNGGNVSAAGLNRANPQAAAAAPVPDDAPLQTSIPTPVPIPSKQTPPSAEKSPKPLVTNPVQPTQTPDDNEPRKVSPNSRYLQVAALKRPDAEHIVHILRERHFPAQLGESPKEGLFRVLVGPFDTMPALADSKARLKSAGFDSIVAR